MWNYFCVNPKVSWETDPEAPKKVVTEAIWGGQAPERISTYALSGRGCGIRHYLENYLGMVSRKGMEPLYPIFMKKVRKAMQSVVDAANVRGEPLNAAEAYAIVEAEWSAEEFEDHPHLSLYRPRAFEWVGALSRVYDPEGETLASFETDVAWQASGRECTIPLQLIGHFQDARGRRVGIGFRPKAFNIEGRRLTWSKLDKDHRLPFVLIYETDPEVQTRVFSPEDETLYDYHWHNRTPVESIFQERDEARARLETQMAGVFRAQPNQWGCDRCSHRMSCPYWMGLVVEPKG